MKEAGGGKDKPKKAGGPAKEKDPDPDGAKLAQTPDPLGEASNLIRMLKTHAGARLQTHLLAFEVRVQLNNRVSLYQTYTRHTRGNLLIVRAATPRQKKG